VDDDSIPFVAPQVREVAVGFERVDGDKGSLEVSERIARGRQLLPDSLDALRVEADEGNGELRPHLMLHLLKHMLGCDDKDPVPASPFDEFGEDESDLDRFAEADRIGEKDARAKILRIE